MTRSKKGGFWRRHRGVTEESLRGWVDAGGLILDTRYWILDTDADVRRKKGLFAAYFAANKSVIQYLVTAHEKKVYLILFFNPAE